MKFNKFVPTIFSITLLAGCFEKSADEHYQQAQTHLTDKKVETAIIELKNAIVKAPKTAEYRFILGQIYFDQGNFAAAEKELSKAKSLGLKDRQLEELLMQSFYYTNNRAEVINLANNHTLGIFQYYAALVDLQEGQITEAKSKLSFAAKEDDFWGQIAKAYSQSVNNELDAALAILKQVLVEAPDNIAALELNAQIFLSKRDYASSVSAFEALTRAYPQHLPFVLQLATAYVNNKQTDKAQPIVKKLLDAHANHGYLHYLQSQISFDKQDFTLAKTHAETAIQSSIDNSTTRLIAAYSNYNLGKYEQAYEHMATQKDRLPASHFANKLLVDLQLRLGYEDEAMETLTELSANNQADSSLLSSASQFMLRSGNKAAAESLLEESIEASSDSAEDFARQGLLRLQLSQLEQSTSALEKALELNPELDVAEQGLATAYLKQNNLEKASQIAQRWKSSDDVAEQAKGWLLESSIYGKQGNAEKLQYALGKVLELDKDNIAALFRMALFSHQAQKFETATQYYIQVLSHISNHGGALQGIVALAQQRPELRTSISAWFEKQSATQNQSVNFVIHHALLKTTNQNIDGAIALLEKARRNLSNQPTEQATLDIALGDIFLATKNYDRAISHFKGAMIAELTRDKAELRLLNAYEQSGKLEDALALIDNKLKQMPDNLQLKLIKVYYQAALNRIPDKKLLDELQTTPQVSKHWLLDKTLGYVALNNKEFTTAAKHLENTYKKQPNEANLLGWMRAASFSKQPDTVINAINQSEYLEKSSALHMTLANAYLDKQDFTNAYETYKKISDKFDANFVVLNNLAYLSLQRGLTTESLSFAKRAYNLAPKNPGVIDTYAMALVANGDALKALDYFDLALEAAPGNVEINLNKAQALIELKFNDEAKELLQQLNNPTNAQQEKANQMLKSL